MITVESVDRGAPGLAYSVATGQSTTGGINHETALQESQHVNRHGQSCPEPVNAQSGLETFAPHRTTRRKQSALRTFIAPTRFEQCSAPRHVRRGEVDLPLRDPAERCVNVSGIYAELTVLRRLSRWRPESSWSEETAPARSGSGRAR